MKTVSLKNTSDDSCCAYMSRDRYGYGLRIYIEADQAEAMGITKALRAGTQVTISAKAIVVSSTESVESDGGSAGNDVSMSLQITDMGIEAGTVLRNAAQTLYGDD